MRNKIFLILLVSLLFVVVGSVGVSADGIDEYTKLMLHLDGTDNSTTDADFIDSSASEHTVTQEGDAKLENTEKKFGVTSGYFDGTGDYLTVPDSEDFNFGSGNFTIDMWIYPEELASNMFVAQRQDSTHVWYFYITSTENYIRFMVYITSTQVTFNIEDAGLTLNTWQHIALVRSNDDYYFFVDGVKKSDAYNNIYSIPDLASNIIIGAQNDNEHFKGYMDEVRISKGVARWTANFTPDTSPYSLSIDYGDLTLSWISPDESTYVAQNEFWNYTFNLSCSSAGDCGLVNVTLDPWAIDELMAGNDLQLDSEGNVVGVVEAEPTIIEKNWFEKIVEFVKEIFRD